MAQTDPKDLPKTGKAADWLAHADAMRKDYDTHKASRSSLDALNAA